MHIEEVNSPEQKAQICDKILRALPNWFGIEESIVEYVDQVQSMPFLVAVDEGAPVGVVAINKHNLHTFEVHVMGVLPAYHRHGVGKKLLESCVTYCKDNGAEFLTVKTVDESREDASYAKTRRFYAAMGFKPLEVFPLLWGEENPCLLMVKYLG